MPETKNSDPEYIITHINKLEKNESLRNGTKTKISISCKWIFIWSIAI